MYNYFVQGNKDNKIVFDFNSDIAQEFGVYKNDDSYEIAKYMSTVNVSAGFHAGDAISIKKALEFAKENSLSISAHIGYPDIAGFGRRNMQLSPDEIEAVVIYQIGAITSFAKTMSLEIENVRCHGAMKENLVLDIEFAKSVAKAIKKVNPWLNFYVPDAAVKKIIEEEVQIKAPYEVLFSDSMSIRQLREMEIVPETIHFTSLDNAKRAYDVIKPAPVNYNRVKNQI